MFSHPASDFLPIQLFANRFRFDEVTQEALVVTDEAYLSTLPPRANFDTLLWAFVTIFQVLTAENWNTVMFDGRRAAGDVLASAYFVALVVLGNFIVLNLFLAILLGNFNVEAVDDDESSTGSGASLETRSTPPQPPQTTASRRLQALSSRRRLLPHWAESSFVRAGGDCHALPVSFRNICTA